MSKPQQGYSATDGDPKAKGVHHYWGLGHSEPVCGRWDSEKDQAGSQWPLVTCPECMKDAPDPDDLELMPEEDPSVIHRYEDLGYSMCGAPINYGTSSYVTEWAGVTCLACLGMKPEPLVIHRRVTTENRCGAEGPSEEHWNGATCLDCLRGDIEAYLGRCREQTRELAELRRELQCALAGNDAFDPVPPQEAKAEPALRRFEAVYMDGYELQFEATATQEEELLAALEGRLPVLRLRVGSTVLSVAGLRFIRPVKEDSRLGYQWSYVALPEKEGQSERPDQESGD